MARVLSTPQSSAYDLYNHMCTPAAITWLMIIRKVKMGLGWDAGCDVDASCAMLNADKSIHDIVFFQKLSSSDGSIKHSGDDRTGEGGESQFHLRIHAE
eukprot:191776-Pyramimonas_sp.AAC.1